MLSTGGGGTWGCGGHPGLGPASGLSCWKHTVPPLQAWAPSVPSSSDNRLLGGLPCGPCSLQPILQHCQSIRKGSPASSPGHSKVCNDADHLLNQDRPEGQGHLPRVCSGSQAHLPSPSQTPSPSPASLLPEPQSSHTPTCKSGGHSSSGWMVLSAHLSFMTHKHPCSAKASTTPADDKHLRTLQSTIHDERTAARNINTPTDKAKT